VTRDVPDAVDLLATAREAVLDTLVPALAGDAQYTARMVAHALGIVARELAAAPRRGAGGHADADGTARDSDPDVAADNALAERIRAGAFAHGAARARLHAALVAATAARRAINDPRAAARSPGDGASARRADATPPRADPTTRRADPDPTTR
jgi:hypothetical protein